MTTALESFEYPWDVETSMALWPGSTIVCQVLFRIKQLFAATQTLLAGAAAAQILAMSDAAEPEHQPLPVSVTPFLPEEMDTRELV